MMQFHYVFVLHCLQGFSLLVNGLDKVRRAELLAYVRKLDCYLALILTMPPQFDLAKAAHAEGPPYFVIVEDGTVIEVLSLER